MLGPDGTGPNAAWEQSLPYPWEWYEQTRPKWCDEALGVPLPEEPEFVHIRIDQFDAQMRDLPNTWYTHSPARPLRQLLENHVRHAVTGRLSFTGCGTSTPRAAKASVVGVLEFQHLPFPRGEPQEIDLSQTPEELGLRKEIHIRILNLVINWE